MSAPPTLLFCIGAAKSGTTWLYNYLYAHPECHLRGVKELHYFDALDNGDMDRQMIDNLRRIEGARTRAEQSTETGDKLSFRALKDARDRQAWLKVQSGGHENAQAYLGYLMGGRKDERVIADITPSYAMLSQARFATMDRLLPDVRFLFLMRDPLQRLWSHVRMVAARRRAGTDPNKAAAQVLKVTLAGEQQHIAARSDYAATITNLTAVVPATRRLIMTFEEMLAGGITRICAFLGIADRPAQTDKVSHRGKDALLSAADRLKALAWLRPQYEFVTEFLGGLPAGWDPDGLGART